MERSSLALATDINSRGIYVVRAPSDGQRVSHPGPGPAGRGQAAVSRGFPLQKTP